MGNYVRKTTTCPCCRRRMPEDFFPKRVPRLSDQQERIIALVRQNNADGIDGLTLVQRIYAAEPDGGPIGALNVIHQQIANINRKLKTWTGARIKSTGGRFGVYHLETLAQDGGFIRRDS